MGKMKKGFSTIHTINRYYLKQSDLSLVEHIALVLLNGITSKMKEIGRNFSHYLQHITKVWGIKPVS